MRRWIDFAVSLYPAKWRQRYAAEFQALLDDIPFGWREFLNILGGALKMQLSTSGFLYLKLAAVFAALGMLAAFAASLAIPGAYASSAVLRVDSADEQPILSATQQVVSRVTLVELMRRKELNLYPSERSQMPLEDVAAKMASNLEIQLVRTNGPALAVRVGYRYQDAKKAQAVVNAIKGKLTAFFAIRQTGNHGLSVLEEANLPLNPVPPKRLKLLLIGLVVGASLALITALLIRQTRRTLLVTAMGAAGCILGAGLSLLVPNRYVSTAVVRIIPTDQSGALKAAQWLQEQSLSDSHGLTLELTRPGKMRVRSTQGATAMVITFESPDRNQAQARVRAAALQLTGQNRDIELLDNASFPESPDFPNRMVISELGLAAGLLAGFILLWAIRRSAAVSLTGPNFPSVPPSSRC